MINDVIADMFTRIRNSLNERHDSVQVPFSKLKESICKLLVQQGFIQKYDLVKAESGFVNIRIFLKYRSNGTSVISTIKRVSKNSKRVYYRKSQIPKVLNGFGLAIMSTSQGVLSGKDARLKNTGGEIIGVVW